MKQMFARVWLGVVVGVIVVFIVVSGMALMVALYRGLRSGDTFAIFLTFILGIGCFFWTTMWALDNA